MNANCCIICLIVLADGMENFWFLQSSYSCNFRLSVDTVTLDSRLILFFASVDLVIIWSRTENSLFFSVLK